MKSKSQVVILFLGLFSSMSLWAQKAAVTDIPMDEGTTISINKGQNAAKCDKMYEIVDGSAQIEGDPSVLVKEARANWKKACTDWKKEVKEMNSDSKIMALDCGAVACVIQGKEGQVCRSEGKYKIKTKIN